MAGFFVISKFKNDGLIHVLFVRNTDEILAQTKNLALIYNTQEKVEELISLKKINIIHYDINHIGRLGTFNNIPDFIDNFDDLDRYVFSGERLVIFKWNGNEWIYTYIPSNKNAPLLDTDWWR